LSSGAVNKKVQIQQYKKVKSQAWGMSMVNKHYDRTVITPFTFVFVICKRFDEKAGCSPAPTRATRDVQNSISTMPIPPSAFLH